MRRVSADGGREDAVGAARPGRRRRRGRRDALARPADQRRPRRRRPQEGPVTPRDLETAPRPWPTASCSPFFFVRACVCVCFLIFSLRSSPRLAETLAKAKRKQNRGVLFPATMYKTRPSEETKVKKNKKKTKEKRNARCCLFFLGFVGHATRFLGFFFFSFGDVIADQWDDDDGFTGLQLVFFCCRCCCHFSLDRPMVQRCQGRRRRRNRRRRRENGCDRPV